MPPHPTHLETGQLKKIICSGSLTVTVWCIALSHHAPWSMLTLKTWTGFFFFVLEKKGAELAGCFLGHDIVRSLRLSASLSACFLTHFQFHWLDFIVWNVPSCMPTQGVCSSPIFFWTKLGFFSQSEASCVSSRHNMGALRLQTMVAFCLDTDAPSGLWPWVSYFLPVEIFHLLQKCLSFK
jgi:hypothetical protein